MTTAKELGTRLRQMRKARHYTLTDLAARSGVAVSTLSKIENGPLSPTFDKVLRLAKGPGISIGRLIGEEAAEDAPRPNSRFLPARHGESVTIDTGNYEYD